MTHAEDALRREVEALREELEARTRALEEFRRRKNHFLTALAHELRNPLAVIHLALEDVSPPDRATLLLRNVEHMRRLIDDLLDTSRIERARMELRRSDVDLVAIVSTTLEDARAYFEQGGTRILLRAPQGPLWVSGDPVRLTQVVMNLVDNAVKYSPSESEVCVDLTVDQGRVTVSVSDCGKGLAAGEQESIFELFEQGDPSLGRHTAGLGIGLTLVRSLVELHGGKVRAESDGPGQGARFVVELDLLAEAEKAEQEAQRVVEPVWSGPLRALLVEDGDELRELLAHRLRGRGVNVATASSGSDALEWLADSTCDAMLVDLCMPGMTGFELAREVRARRPEIRLVALSGLASEKDRREAVEAGFVEHLVKPSAIDEVLRALRPQADQSDNVDGARVRDEPSLDRAARRV